MLLLSRGAIIRDRGFDADALPLCSPFRPLGGGRVLFPSLLGDWARPQRARPIALDILNILRILPNSGGCETPPGGCETPPGGCETLMGEVTASSGGCETLLAARVALYALIRGEHYSQRF